MGALRRILLAGVLATFAGSPASAQTVTRPVLTLDGARLVLAEAEAFARSKGVGGAIAVVDDGGNLLALHRLDGTFPMASTISIGKARTAALFRKPTAFFEELVVQKGRVSMTALPDFTPLKGGVPIVVDGQVVGAVGVSGAASADQDDEMAQACARAIETGAVASAVTFIEKTAVSAAFQKGAPLFETPDFKIHASRRDGPGAPEVHLRDTDLIYVVDGTATLVTGGTLVDARDAGPGERSGSSLAGGETRKLVPGDVLVVPAGTPHWFQSVPGPFQYYVVKTPR